MERVWSVREYRDGDEEGLLELRRNVHGKVPDEEQWRRRWKWMHRDNPAGKSRIWLAEHDNIIIGQCPFFFTQMKVGEEVATAAHSRDLMTDPNYRRQGISYTLQTVGQNEVAKEGISIMYSFPNKSNYLSKMKSGWYDVGLLQFRFKILNTKNLLRKHVGNKLLLAICTAVANLLLSIFFKTKEPPKINGLTISRVSFFDDRIDDLWKRVSHDYEIITVRNKEYLNWRYTQVPGAKYEIYIAEKDGQVCGYIVLRAVKEGSLVKGYIFDLLILSNREDVAHCLLSKAIQYFKHQKADFIYCKMMVGKRLLNIFRRAGFLSFRPLGKRKGRFCIYNSNLGISKTYLRDRKNWFTQLGDSDLV